MWLIVLEAVAALAVLVFLVWWTMFSGRRGGELPPELSHEEPPDVSLARPPADTIEQVPAAQEGEAGGGGEAGERGGTRKLKG